LRSPPHRGVWGAPLVAQEFEAGTFRLAWTQGVTGTGWLAFKLGVGALPSVVVTGLLSLMVTWWSSPIDTVSANHFDPLLFGARDLTPVGYALFMPSCWGPESGWSCVGQYRRCSPHRLASLPSAMS
jgi:hypothetical protein